MKKLCVLAVIPALLIAGCGESNSQTPSTTTTNGAAVVKESDTVSAIGVLLASLHLLNGDVEEALANGQVTVDEVDAAVSSIQGETISDWVNLASN